jgi:hypothetical protein
MRLAEGDAVLHHLRGACDDEERATVLLQLRPLMRLAGILYGQRMQVELHLHAAEQLLARLQEPDPHDMAGPPRPVAGRLDGDIRYSLAADIDAGRHDAGFAVK